MTHKKQRKGLIQVYTGNSRHHNHAPIGLALRAAGQNLRTHLTCFLPHPLRRGEEIASSLLKPHLVVYQAAINASSATPGGWTKKERSEIREAFQQAQNALFSGEFDIVILEGIHPLLESGIIPMDLLMHLFIRRPSHVEMVLTGPGTHEDLIHRAHLVTEMVCRKDRSCKEERQREAAPTEVVTGNGKGKTTYGLGKAMLMSCLGTPAMILQFIKSARPYGEVKAVRKLPSLDIKTMGEGFLEEHATTQEAKHLDAARQAWEGCLREIFSLKYGGVVLDEINIATHYGLVHPERVRELMFLKPRKLHLILSGRNAHPEVMEGASRVIEMKEIKHPYHQGIKARKGIEF